MKQNELALQEKIQHRGGDIRAMLLERAPECFEEQRHLTDDSIEQAYWYYGYLMALNDTSQLIAASDWGIDPIVIAEKRMKPRRVPTAATGGASKHRYMKRAG